MNFNLTKEQQLILLGLIASIVIGLGVMTYRHFSGSASEEIVIEQPKNPIDSSIMVHISGAVRKEGVYKMKAGDRLLDVIEMAGGALPRADLSAVNLAEPIKDGEKIIIPTKGIVENKASGNQESMGRETSSRKVNINVADEKTLDSLPGIGPATAKAIIEYRRTNGPFSRIEQIMEIPRFGKSKFERIRDKITI